MAMEFWKTLNFLKLYQNLVFAPSRGGRLIDSGGKNLLFKAIFSNLKCPKNPHPLKLTMKSWNLTSWNCINTTYELWSHKLSKAAIQVWFRGINRKVGKSKQQKSIKPLNIAIEYFKVLNSLELNSFSRVMTS